MGWGKYSKALCLFLFYTVGPEFPNPSFFYFWLVKMIYFILFWHNSKPFFRCQKCSDTVSNCGDIVRLPKHSNKDPTRVQNSDFRA